MKCDLGKLADELKKCEDGGVDSIHVDVMDGHFVPNFALGVETTRAIREYSSLPMEIHLMVERPDKYWKAFRDAGGSRFLIHYESQADILTTAREIARDGFETGLAINPETSFSRVSDMVGEFDSLLAMTIHPGFSGQKFMEETVPKVKEASTFISGNNLKTLVEVDGGITYDTGRLCAEAGAKSLASASYIFNNDRVSNIRKLKSL